MTHTPYRFANRLALLAVVLLVSAATVRAQDAVYDDGSVWEITYVRTEPGQFDNYLADLRANWRQVQEVAIEQDVVLSYKVISAPAANRDDWDLVLLVEYPNMAVMDRMRETMMAFSASHFGSQQQGNHAQADRRQLREILGMKLGRELVFND